MRRLKLEILAATTLLLATPSLSGLGAEAKIDPRIARLREYLDKRDFPVKVYAQDFVQAADENKLDWRLLPSISIVESTGGKHLKNNNVFGWANGEHKFSSVRHGIYRVAHQLNHGRAYRGKDVAAKLATYNTNPEYRTKVMLVMKQIGPAEFGASRPAARPRGA
jgi:flagellum-specific peptidoglycan hydrolase FlgJ